MCVDGDGGWIEFSTGEVGDSGVNCLVRHITQSHLLGDVAFLASLATPTPSLRCLSTTDLSDVGIILDEDEEEGDEVTGPIQLVHNLPFIHTI